MYWVGTKNYFYLFLTSRLVHPYHLDESILVVEASSGCIHFYELAWTKSRKSYCTTPGIGVGGGGVSKMLKFLR